MEEKESNGETKMDDDDWEIVGEENFNNSKSQVQKLDDVDVVQENMAQAFRFFLDGVSPGSTKNNRKNPLNLCIVAG